MISDFRFGRGEFAGFALGSEAVAAVGAVAEGLVFGEPAAAKRDDGTTGEAVGVAFRILYGEVAFDADGSVVEDGDFSCHETRW